MKSFGPSKSGIYEIIVDGKRYVGKDTQIQKERRIKQHLNALKTNTHYNAELQDAFNRTHTFSSNIVEELGLTDDVTDAQLCDREVYWIDKLNAYIKGWNKTTGGIGGNGIVVPEGELRRRRVALAGDGNPQSKIDLPTFLQIVEMFKNDVTNKEIGERVGLHPQYVSLIRHKRRYKLWFEQYAPDYEVISARPHQGHNTILDDDQVKDIFLSSKSKRELADSYNVSLDIIANIKRQRTFKRITDSLL